MDYLATEALQAISAARPELRGWVDDKSEELDGMSRLDVLRWIVHKVDPQNLELIAGRLGVTVADLKATARVLQKI